MKIAIAVITMLFAVAVQAQTPAEFATLDAAGRVTLVAGTKQVTAPDPKDATKQITETVRDADKVIVRVPRFDPATGEQTGTNDREFSISGMEADIARMQADLDKAQAQLAKMKAVK